MTDGQQPVSVSRASDFEIINMRQALTLLKTQISSGRVDTAYLSKQLDRMSGLLEKLEAERTVMKAQAQTTLLYTVTRAVGESLDLQHVLDTVMDSVITLTSADRGFLMLRDDDGGLTVHAARNFDQQTLGSDQFKYSRGVVNRVMETGESVLTTNAAEDPRFNMQASIVNQQLRTIVAVPLAMRGQNIGVIYADTRNIASFGEETTVESLKAFASQAAIAIENARLFAATDQELAAKVDLLTKLRGIDRQLAETLDPVKAIELTLEFACRMSGAEIGHLGLLNDGRMPAAYHFGLPKHDTQPLLLDRTFPQVNEAIERQETVLNDNRSVMVVPIVHEGNVIGAVVLRHAGRFTESQQDIVERVLARAASAIENSRLYAAVQAADQAKSEFVGVVAHDLKVPMTSILGYADLLLMDDNLIDYQVTYVNRIRDTVRRMEKLVSDLADISRIEAGQFFMDENSVDVESIAQGIRDAIQTQMSARQHLWQEDIEEGLPYMRADYYRLLQVLTNLTSNAYKYTPDGGTITFAVRRDPVFAGRIEFSITDTGIGLTAEQIRNLGTKFWRAEDEFTRSQPGSGLGFAITRSLVEQMGSEIRIESQPGRGSRFSFSVPVDDGEAR
ncbi:MAG: GAF domain-containing protein [Pleurocapsa minor GSE-CHR-MK-17-07R]|jgi:signal transduction histidine kinase|nr:GAF domain-containing protein [Pleurocapsa minor GSE-CHR-MK 17-07R]